MGRAAVLNTACWLGAAGVVQLAGFPSSRAITVAGGREFDITWSLCLVLGATLAITARLVADHRHPEREAYASVLEVGANALLILGVGTYLVLIFDTRRGERIDLPQWWPDWTTPLEGRVVLIALCMALVTNLAGRSALLLRQMRHVAEQTREARRDVE